MRKAKKRQAEKEMKQKIGLFSKLEDSCLVCEKVFDKTTLYPAGYEIDCSVDYPSSEIKRFVPYNKRDREWQGWYRLDIQLIDGVGNTNTVQYCKALRIVGGWQSSYSDTTTYQYNGYYWQYWNEVYRNKGQC